MPHSTSYNEQKQQHCFLSVKEKAWHKLGQVVENYPTSKEALQFAELDFEVLKRPNIDLLDNGRQLRRPILSIRTGLTTKNLVSLRTTHHRFFCFSDILPIL